MSTSRSARRVVLTFAAACAALSACISTNDYDSSAPRLIDYECHHGDYELSGAADVTSGLTADSCAFELGPAQGSVHFDLPLTTSFEALVAVNGSDISNWTTQNATDGTVSNTPGQRLRVLDIRVRRSQGNCD
ncbi:MAG TPA: hypothetical protein VGI10_12910 [Polyangiaceae bacterium]|jgi:hypothetical protein